MWKANTHIFLATILSLSFMGLTRPAMADLSGFGDSIKVYDLARCSANNLTRLLGAELNTTNLQLHNFESVHSVTITRLLICDAQGVSIFDSKILGLPPFNNGILGPTNDVLKPHQSVTVGLADFLPPTSPTTRPLQLLVESSSLASALPVHVRVIAVIRARDPSTGSIGEERSRSGEKCESVRRLRPLD